MKAIVTTGGSREPIDDVRFIANFSSGKFGVEIARELAGSGFETTLVCAPDVAYRTSGNADVSFAMFTTAKSLREYLLGQQDVDVIFHAAAVADFTPAAPVSGKISSDKERLTLELARTPKIILDLRTHFGKKTFLVGFKLLSGADPKTLIAAAHAQNEKYKLNLTVANDLSEMKDGNHPVWLVTPEGGAIRIVGNRHFVATCIVEFVKRRMQTNWFSTQHTENTELEPEPLSIATKNFSSALSFMQRSNLLYDVSGNVSASEEGSDVIMVTPRHVNKRTVRALDCSDAFVDLSARVVFSMGPGKPSIDTGMQAMLYEAFPGIRYLLHFHRHWGLFGKKTSFPYPCGTKEEGNEVIRCLGENVAGEFAIELLHHGALIGLDEQGLQRLTEEWNVAREEHTEHIQAVHQEKILEMGRQRPIFADTHIVGVVLEAGGMVAPFISERYRGHRVGYELLRQIKERRILIITVDDCHVVDFYRKHGFAGDKDPVHGAYVLHPPSHDDTDKLFSHIEEWKI